MKFLILMGSPRKHSNTAELCKPLIDELSAGGAEVKYITLADKQINPCLGCYSCQKITDSYGCIQQDDMTRLIAGEILWADCIILATPIYAWYCTTAMKAVLDRHYGFNKFYGREKANLWQGKKVALVVTHGYEGEYAYGPFETGIQRLCKHSKLEYVGLYSVEDEDDLASFRTEAAVNGAREFARTLLNC